MPPLLGENKCPKKVLYLQSRVTPQFTAIAAGGDETPVRFFAEGSCDLRVKKLALKNRASFALCTFRKEDEKTLFFSGSFLLVSAAYE